MYDDNDYPGLEQGYTYPELSAQTETRLQPRWPQADTTRTLDGRDPRFDRVIEAAVLRDMTLNR